LEEKKRHVKIDRQDILVLPGGVGKPRLSTLKWKKLEVIAG
jgi:hypothetical protein